MDANPSPRPRETRSQDWYPTRLPFLRRSRPIGRYTDRGVGRGRPSTPLRSFADPDESRGRSQGAAGRQCFSPFTSTASLRLWPSTASTILLADLTSQRKSRRFLQAQIVEVGHGFKGLGQAGDAFAQLGDVG